MMELVGQVGVQCVERGHLLYQLWNGLRGLLRAAMMDRDRARQAAWHARREETLAR